MTGMNGIKKSAVISERGRYRYELRRIWDESNPWVLFICLNPSMADHEKDDNTSRVCINYAKRWGYGGVVLGNLFAYRATDRAEIYRVDDPVGPENDAHLRRLCGAVAEVVCAWSDDGGFRDRDLEVLPLIRNPKCLTLLKSGRPGHPLYKKRGLALILMKKIFNHKTM